jgi:hypothetical protein
MLEVPFHQKDEAKALGARWDREAQSWYVPAGRDPAPFQRWLPRQVPMDGPTIPARLLGQVQRCYRCTSRGVALTGILVSPRYSLDPSGFISFDSISRALAALVNDTPLAERLFIGRIRMRSSQAHPGGYVANACRYCDALWGSFPLQEAVTEFLAEGGTYERLVIDELEFPISALPDLRSAWDDELDDDDDVDRDDDEPDHVPRPVPFAGVDLLPGVLRDECWEPGYFDKRRAQADLPATASTPPHPLPARGACPQAPASPTARRWRPWRR